MSHSTALMWRDDDVSAALMGIMNLTPDSFSDGGEIASISAATSRALQLWQDGATWVDIGGESTRPGADPVSEEAECQRVLPAITAIHAARPEGLISIDTRHAAVADAALTAGAAMVNDVSGGRDPRLLEVTAGHGAALVLMHMQGVPQTMQIQPSYDSVIDDVSRYLEGQVERAVAAGVRRNGILIDPGIGFGKSVEHNLCLLKGLKTIRQRVGRPILLGLSRKSLLPAMLGRELSREQRDHASHIVHALCMGEVALIRCHDVPGAVDALALARAFGRGHIA